MNLSNKHILCVDDNPQNATLIKALLENTQAIVTIAHDGMEAIQLAETQLFDLILMDIRMPKLDGYEALKIIRTTQNKNISTPVIAISAHISDDEHDQLNQIGFNCFLVKPVIKSTLLETIQAQINNTAVIDLELGTKLAGNKRDAAEEMLGLLIKSLPTDIVKLKSAKESEDYPELLRRVHKLHGALCYCGVPRLKNITANLESALKNKQYSEATLLFNRMMIEAELVLEALA